MSAAGVPTVVVGGWLGAGKTTLVNQLLRQADGQRIAVLVNDFGELAIDDELIVGAHGEVLALAGGCICCSFGADLVGTLQRLLQQEPAPERVLIECSGVGLPAAVARSARLLPQLQLHGVVVVLDAGRAPALARDAYVGDTLRQQVADAQRLVLNKIDRLQAGEHAALTAWLDDAAPAVPAIESVQCELPAEWVWLPAEGSPTARVAARPPAASRRFRSECRRLDDAVDADALLAGLRAEGDALLRVKGWFTRADGQRCLLQGAGGQWRITPAPLHAPPRGPDRLLMIRRQR